MRLIKSGIWLVALLLLATGCSQSDKKVDSESDSGKTQESSTVNDEARALLPAKSIEDLVLAYKLAFASGDVDAFTMMAHEENIDNKELFEAVYGILMGGRRAGNHYFQKAEIVDTTADDFEEGMSFRPVAILIYTHRSDDESVATTDGLPIVEVDGHFYFYLYARKL